MVNNKFLRCLIFLLLLLLVTHVLLNGILFLIALFCIGVLSYVLFRYVRFFVLAVLLAEIFIAAGYYSFLWMGSNALINLSHNSSIPIYIWVLLTSFVNIVTASLCVNLSYHSVRSFYQVKRNV